MKKLKGYLWGVAVAALIAASAVTAKYSPENKFERAQRETVLLTLPDGQGSGVVVRRESVDGVRLFIWTAAHVVEGFSEVEVSYFVRYGGERVGRVSFKARVLARDDAKDIALLWLKADPNYFGAAVFDFDPQRVGDKQFHVGNFYGDAFDGSVSSGILSQIGIKPEDPQWPWATPLDQTTCAAIFGSSGGPVFDVEGEVVGLIVGGAVGNGFIEYVPTREILKWAHTQAIAWAVVGRYCPSDSTLELAIPVAVSVVPVTDVPIEDHRD